MGVAPQYQGYPALATQGLPQKHSKAPFIVLGVVGCILVAVLAMFALIVGQLGHRNFDRQAASYGQNSPPDGSGPSADSGPSHAGHPQIPSPPAPPPPPDLSDSSQGPLASLIYPGSKQTVNVHGDREGTIILSTSDPTSKVVDWYIARLPNANVVNIPFVGGAVVTKGQISVTITPGSPTTVVLAMEKKAR